MPNPFSSHACSAQRMPTVLAFGQPGQPRAKGVIWPGSVFRGRAWGGRATAVAAAVLLYDENIQVLCRSGRTGGRAEVCPLTRSDVLHAKTMLSERGPVSFTWAFTPVLEGNVASICNAVSSERDNILDEWHFIPMLLKQKSQRSRVAPLLTRPERAAPPSHSAA